MEKNLVKQIESLVDKAFNKAIKKSPSSKKVVEFSNIEDYEKKTGRRYRMLKEQKNRGLSREEAFSETFL